jgi:hypothetical protein
VRVTFNKAINPASFTPDQVTFTGPPGAIGVTGVVAVPGSGNTQFDIQFAPQSDLGSYYLVIGPNILDTAGNPMDQNGNYVAGEVPNDQYQAVFTIMNANFGPDGFGYRATPTPFRQVDIVGQPGTFTIISAADDSSVPVDLGTNTFSFYGHTYTGNNQLFVSSNGLITFGSGNSEYTNTDLTNGDPAQASIAVLWDDWIKNAGDPTGPMIVGKFATFQGHPVLVIEWNQIMHFGASGRVSFQAVLGLNTGTTAGDFGMNFLSLASGDAYAEGASATVGSKDVGNQGPNRLLVSFDSGNSPVVGTRKALRFSVSSGGSPANLATAFPLGQPDAGTLVVPSLSSTVGGPAPVVPPAEPGSGSATDSLFAIGSRNQLAIADVASKPDELSQAAGLADLLADPGITDRQAL